MHQRAELSITLYAGNASISVKYACPPSCTRLDSKWRLNRLHLLSSRPLMYGSFPIVIMRLPIRVIFFLPFLFFFFSKQSTTRPHKLPRAKKRCIVNKLNYFEMYTRGKCYGKNYNVVLVIVKLSYTKKSRYFYSIINNVNKYSFVKV